MSIAVDAPPISLSFAEYERDWKPSGWELLYIGPTTTWRQEWSEWEAIRDIVQNSLDETERYRFGTDGEGLWIIDNGKGVAVADFLLGPPKLKSDYARGKFGEGMKIAALSLLRSGYPVHIKTVNRELWMVFTQQRVNGHVETLGALWKKDGIRIGTEFHIIGYFGSAFEDRFVVNLPPTAIVADVPSPIYEPIQRYNQLIKYDFPPISTEAPGTSRIFARDIYMKNINSPFSYNLWGFDMAPDRHAAKKEDDMWVDMGRLWSGVTNRTLLETFLLMVIDPPQIECSEARSVNMNSSSMGRAGLHLYTSFMTENAEVWLAAWNVVIGKDAVIRTDPRWDGMVKHLGYKSQSVSWGVLSALRNVIGTDTQLVEKSQESLRKVQIVPDDRLTQAALTHLYLARYIAARFVPTLTGRKVAVHAAVIPPASDIVRTAGLYDMNIQEIMLDLETLEKVRNTIDALIHELGHHIAFINTEDPLKAEDLQPAHSTAMTSVAARVWELAVDNELDDYLKGVVW